MGGMGALTESHPSLQLSGVWLGGVARDGGSCVVCDTRHCALLWHFEAFKADTLTVS